MSDLASNCTTGTETEGNGRSAIALTLCSVLLAACGAGSQTDEPVDSATTVEATTTLPIDPSQSALPEQEALAPVELGAATATVDALGGVDAGGNSGDSETSVSQIINEAPKIEDTSYNCDPVVESVAFDVGQNDSFTLAVTDESPLTLSYAADTSNADAVSVEVDNNGVFTIEALQAGEAWVWLTAEDDEGLADEYEMHVIVQ